jgi:putative addiction module CopG family antidote
MPTMNISLTDHLKEVFEQRIAKGRYSSASEYVRDLIRADEVRSKNVPRSAQENKWSVNRSKTAWKN